MKHVSGAQLTGTRADAEKRCQAASWISGWFAPPGKFYPGAASSLAARAAPSFPLRREAPSRAQGARPAKRGSRAVRAPRARCAPSHPAVALFPPGKGPVSSLENSPE